MRKASIPSAGQVKVTGGFLKHYMDIMAEKALSYQWQVLSGQLDANRTVRNFRIAAGEETGEFAGVPYQDTDLSKWLDAVGCALANRRDETLEKIADEIIATIEKAQDEDGYLDTYYQLVCPAERWTDPESHELYCFGHMIEAGVSYYEGTGKDVLLKVACRLADHVARTFGPGENQIPGYRGHEIIEMALSRLADATGNRAYHELAAWFVHARGEHPEQFYLDGRKEGNPLDYGCWGWGDPEKELSSYEHVTGHAVRAMYLYAGMADVARTEDDEALAAHCEKLFHDVTDSQMYITGGIGTTAVLEAYTYPYDLPNSTMYAESCASIGLCFFAQRLLRMKQESSFADAMERCVYNILPAAVAQDGMHYFYVNPLEINEEACRRSPLKTHVKAQRQAWYECACCPPNLARFFLSMPRYLYSMEEKRLNVHLYAESEASVMLDGQNVCVKQTTRYPEDGAVVLQIACDADCTAEVSLRIPEWCSSYQAALDGIGLDEQSMENGYLVISGNWKGTHEIRLEMDMKPQWIRSNVRVRENGGKLALCRGPVVYCVEEADNGILLQDLAVSSAQAAREVLCRNVDGFGDYIALEADATRSGQADTDNRRLYFPANEERIPVKVRAVPYCLWGERKPGEMLVWMNRG